MTILIHTLTDADMEWADEILKLAFRSPISRLHDLWLYRRIEPNGWFLALRNGQPVGMVGAVNYESFAYVGLMAVRPDSQRQGIGLTLMRHVLSWIEEQQVTRVLLDASKDGHPLYKKLGFTAYDETLVFHCHGDVKNLAQPSSQVQPISINQINELTQWDTEVFGANRRKVFHALFDAFPGRVFIQRDVNGQLAGYLFAQKNRIGPWVMLQPCNGTGLLQAALALPYEGTVSVMVPSVNQEAIELLQSYSFEQVRTNRHMGKGTASLPGQRKKIYAQTSLAVG